MEKKFEKNESVETSFDEKNLIALKKKMKDKKKEKSKPMNLKFKIQNYIRIKKLHFYR